MSSGKGAPGPECGSADVRQLCAEAADLCRRIARLERDRPPSGQSNCRDLLPVASTAFTYGALTMFVIMILLDREALRAGYPVERRLAAKALRPSRYPRHDRRHDGSRRWRHRQRQEAVSAVRRPARPETSMRHGNQTVSSIDIIQYIYEFNSLTL